MPSSHAVTRGIHVDVDARFSPEHSAPTRQHWFFLYTITITNKSDITVQLVGRAWHIIDDTGRVEETGGPAIVGEQPVLMPGESFEYTSGCPLPTPVGTMEGTYQALTPTGEQFEVEIGRFTLQGPYSVH